MKKLMAIFLVFGTSSLQADQKAALTCTGENIVLKTRAPYLGENRPESQIIYILNSAENPDESANSAYFLDVDIEGDVDAYGMIWTTGKNEKGGWFTLRHKFWQDVGDGTIVNELTSGLLSYKHGPMSGNEEPVECVRQ